MTISNKQIAIVSLLLGSIAAPIIYIITGVLFPKGFHFFIKGEVLTFVYPFLVVWLTSLIFTIIIGTIFWKILHKHNLDGFIIYILISLLCSSLLSYFFSSSLSYFIVGMSAANAVLVRLIEIVLSKQR